MNVTEPHLWALPALAVPLTFALGGLFAPRRAEAASAVAALVATFFALGALTGGDGTALGVRVDALTRVLLVLVTFLGAVIVRYSRNYLDGEPGTQRYFRWLLFTLSAVTLLVSSSNMLVIATAWAATSVALHQLLTFYSNRPAALVAAHKKFLVSRLADGALALSLWLLYSNVGSFDLDRIAAWVELQSHMPASMEVAACLLVAAVALRTAQLPFHGWITQVMEAPTPVSALLHAGVVNIGGFVLIRLAAWIARAESAQTLLVVIGLVTALVGALVMTTRVSVKVALAWSTCAQMGFMLVQCGLGLWALALLHLVAHSLYKAHAFLSAGSAVEEWKASAFATRPLAESPLRLGALTVAAVGVAFVGLAALRPYLGLPALQGIPAITLTWLLGLSLVVLMATPPGAGVRGVLNIIRRLLGVVILYAGWHAVAEHVMPTQQVAPNNALWLLTGLGFTSLFGLKTMLQWRPNAGLAHRLHPWLFSGLYLDELFTRLTFRLWPPRPAGTTRPAGDFPLATRFAAEVKS